MASALSSSTFTPTLKREPNVALDQRVLAHTGNLAQLKLFPDVILSRYNKDGIVENFSTLAELSHHQTLIFTVKGAWDKEASADLLRYIEYAEMIKTLGIEKIICLTVDKLDPAHQWSSIVGKSKEVEVWTDNEGVIADQTGLGFNNTGDAAGGYAFKNACMLLQGRTIKILWVDTPRSLPIRAKQIFEELRAMKIVHGLYQG